MADADGQAKLLAASTPEEVLAAGGAVKRRRNLSNKTSVERIRNAHSRSPKRRAATPEPEKRYYTDESEKDVSDIERQHTARARVLVQTKDKGQSDTIRRTRSKERPPHKDTTTEIEDDFEIIRKLHKSREEEETAREEEKMKEDVKPKVKDEPRNFEPKEMPPLIMAPTELRKRVRPKTLPLQPSLSEEEKPRTAPRSKSKTRASHRKMSTSEEEDDHSNLALRGKLTLKPKSSNKEPEKVVRAEPRKKKSVKRVKKAVKETPEVPVDAKTDASDVDEGVEVDNEGEDEELEMLNPPEEAPQEEMGPRPGFFQRWFGWGKKRVQEAPQEEKAVPQTAAELEPEVEAEEPEEAEEELEPEAELIDTKQPEPEVDTKPPRRWLIFEIISEWRAYTAEQGNEYDRIMRLKNRCVSSLLLMMIYCGCGGMIFRFTEGTFESFYKCGVKRVKRDFIDSLWSNSQYMLEDDWKSQARRKLMEFENQLHAAHEAGMTSYSGLKSWSFLNAVVYSLTVVTTIGYGHISPSTATGRAITIVYAIFGIPMFLILLADFGKLFTRGIKFLWAFVRRVYYTGSCRKVRKTVPVQEVMKGVQLVYDFAKNRRPSELPGDGDVEQQAHLKPPEPEVHLETPETPALSTFEVDDEFNLPISVAITILVLYIFLGATIYWLWENWTFFESFYFVFISMSTIGFGDFVPQHPMYMMASIVYLVFGLALTSMCINVVQEKLSDTFQQASVKIGATIGLRVAEEEGLTVASAPAELADVNPIESKAVET